MTSSAAREGLEPSSEKPRTNPNASPDPSRPSSRGRWCSEQKAAPGELERVGQRERERKVAAAAERDANNFFFFFALLPVSCSHRPAVRRTCNLSLQLAGVRRCKASGSSESRRGGETELSPLRGPRRRGVGGCFLFLGS